MTATSVREYMFGVASTVPGSFLNNLEDLVYSYADSILPTSTGTQVLVQATTGDEVQVVIDREFWMSATSLLVPVGPAAPGDYNVYVGASTIPTAHSTGIMPFDMIIGTTPPSYDHVRKVASFDWSGTSIGRVLLDARKLNAAQLDGYVATTTPLDEIVPVASSNGKLDHRFRPIFPGVDAELGEVIDFWTPPGAPFSVPSSWALCDGSVVPSGQHDFGPFPITLPDARDKLIYGADPAKTLGAAGSPSNLAGAAPGIGGVKTSHMSDSVLSHSHAMPNHSHVATHQHKLGHHGHFMPLHRHFIGGFNWERSNSGSNHDIALLFGEGVSHSAPSHGTSMTFNSEESDGAVGNIATFDTIGSSMATGFTTITTPGTDAVAGSTDAVAPSLEARPRFYGMARIMKVRLP